MAEIARSSRRLTDPTATATATVASMVPRHRIARDDAEQDGRPEHDGHARHAADRRPEADQGDAEADRLEHEERRDRDGQPGSPEVVADEAPDERVAVAHRAVAGDALDQRSDRQGVEDAEHDEQHGRSDGAEPRERDRQREDPAADGLGQGQREREPERRQRLEPARRARSPPAKALSSRQGRGLGRAERLSRAFCIGGRDRRIIRAKGRANAGRLAGSPYLSTIRRRISARSAGSAGTRPAHRSA